MSAHCCHHRPPPPSADRRDRYHIVLWIALLVNAAMFAVEISTGIQAGSVSLLADSLDFLGDAANYGITLWVLRLSLAIRARAALLKAVSMAAFGVWVIGVAISNTVAGITPDAPTMGMVGGLALAANLAVAALLYGYRDGDSNRRGAWLCTRNDALGNLAVLLAALGVFGTGAAWPDLIVAAIMAGLALTSAVQVIRQARLELATA
ncbi:MAG: cation transporter [Candidatus Competibacteraceae bacterium]|uniref:Cation efflux system protein n=1 Tax=Candidatus Contendobacter odensis Run_B_J11 TaxID=1400861 RepID=A0A7U7GEA7_9GAMM|nr:cation transporter [Candidatus Contendobacter odensis]MBK8537838.1 cation transporter [Candidatus Competibacteraceae bacterium]CDH46752.1 putative Cation efflux system protein [Candidatus Contendobacter odensis Run_B_J11]